MCGFLLMCLLFISPEHSVIDICQELIDFCWKEDLKCTPCTKPGQTREISVSESYTALYSILELDILHWVIGVVTLHICRTYFFFLTVSFKQTNNIFPHLHEPEQILDCCLSLRCCHIQATQDGDDRKTSNPVHLSTFLLTDNSLKQNAFFGIWTLKTANDF